MNPLLITVIGMTVGYILGFIVIEIFNYQARQKKMDQIEQEWENEVPKWLR